MQENSRRIPLCFVVGLFAGSAALSAHAQSNVTLYGVIDSGIATVSNESGHSSVKFFPGQLYGNRWGLKGSEDLGGGLKTVFVLESGFDSGSGAFQQGSAGVTRVFGRQAYVGLSNPWATVTAGRQYDFMFDSLNRYGSGFMGFAWRSPVAAPFFGSNGSSPDIDRLAGARVDNAVKVKSASFSGLTFGGLYSFGGVAGNFLANRTLSAGANYVHGPFSTGIAYTDQQNATGTADYRNMGLGMSYVYGKFIFSGLMVSDRWSATGDTVSVIDVNMKYHATPALLLGLGYSFAKPNHGGANVIINGDRNQYVWIADYFLSKRTDVYFTGAYQHAGGGNHAFLYNTAAASSGASQVALEVGLKHLF